MKILFSLVKCAWQQIFLFGEICLLIQCCAGLSGVDLQDKVRTQGRDPEKAMASGSQRRKTKKKGARNWGLQTKNWGDLEVTK